MELKTQDQFSVTRDFRTLPTEDEINELVDKDAEKISDEIKDKLIHNIKENRGYSNVEYSVSELYVKKVTADIKKWAELFGYTLDYDGKYFTIRLKKYKRFGFLKCPTCESRKKSIFHIASYFFIGSSAAGIITSINLIPYLFSLAPAWYILFIPISLLVLVGAIVSIEDMIRN